MISWAAYLPSAFRNSLAALRLHPSLEVTEIAEEIWVRGGNRNPGLEQALKTVPFTAVCAVAPDGLLTKVGNRVPCAVLPAQAWMPLNGWLKVELPPAALAAELTPRLELKLAPSSLERASAVLVTSLEQWQAFAESAPRLRLDPLRFAANSAGEVVVYGEPLPSLPGRRFYIQGQIALPLGCAWQPAVSPALFARIMRAAPGALVLWENDHTLREIKSEQFVPASRSAARMTRKAGHA